MPDFVLGSASPSRYRLLTQAGVRPVVQPPKVDEDAVRTALNDDDHPTRVVTALAEAKARDVVRSHGRSLTQRSDDGAVLILGCDSLLLVDGRLEGKPHTYERAWQRWQAIRGQHGVLITGHTLIHLSDDSETEAGVRELGAITEATSTTVHFGAPSDKDLDAYLRTGEPLECAGAFTLEAMGGWFIERIEGDPSSVIGLSLPLLHRMIGSFGYSVSDFWA